jgi:hypothetical protein
VLGTHSNAALAENERLQILAHLETLLNSPAFAGSPRRQTFLRYVIEETLAGRGAAIKETSIAVDVFGRSSDFDAQNASIVRVTAAEVRKRLERAYASGLGGSVRIELPVGCYQPTFEFLPLPVTEPQPRAEDRPAEIPRRSRRFVWVGAAAAAVLGIAFVLAQGPKRAPIDRLWEPFLTAGNPVLICLSSPPLFNLWNRDKWLPLKPGMMIPAEDLEVFESSYVGTGGALGAALFAEQLVSRGQRFVVKFGDEMAFADLKNSPAILIGASRWTRELTRGLRFRMQAEDGTLTLIDSLDPSRSWTLRRKNQTAQLAEGYSLITRLLHSESGYPILLVVGMDARNTQGAVEFLARRDSFHLFAQSAGVGWENKNFQVVLHNTIHGNSAGSLKVLAYHVW